MVEFLLVGFLLHLSASFLLLTSTWRAELRSLGSPGEPQLGVSSLEQLVRLVQGVGAKNGEGERVIALES